MISALCPMPLVLYPSIYNLEAIVQTLIYFILVPMVYIAGATFFIGTTLRLIKIFREPKHPATLQIYPEKNPQWLWALHDTFLFPSVRRHKPVLWLFLMDFHIGLFLLVIGHFELIGEFAIFQIIPHEIFLGPGYIGLIMRHCLALFSVSTIFIAGQGPVGTGRLLSSDIIISDSHFRQRDGLGQKMVWV